MGFDSSTTGSAKIHLLFLAEVNFSIVTDILSRFELITPRLCVKPVMTASENFSTPFKFS